MVDHGYMDQILLRIFNGLFDGNRNFLRLAMTDAYPAFTVADDHQSAKAEPASALDNFGNPVDMYDFLSKLLFFLFSVHVFPSFT